MTVLDFLLTAAKNCKKDTIFDNLKTITQEGDFWNLDANTVRLGFCLVRFKKIHIKESKKPGLHFLSS